MPTPALNSLKGPVAFLVSTWEIPTDYIGTLPLGLGSLPGDIHDSGQRHVRRVLATGASIQFILRSIP